MVEQRPAGLTALAIVNFGLTLMSGFAMTFTMVLYLVLTDRIELPAEFKRDMTEAMSKEVNLQEAPKYLLYSMVVSFYSCVLLVTSGIGYLQQKKVLGRWVGTFYGVSMIAMTIANLFILPPDLGGRFNFSTIISLVYPIVTLSLINGPFRLNLVR